jgi:hypothetical protein
MLNKENEPILKQELEKFNKPHILIKIALNKALTARDKKIYNIFVRELLMLNLKHFKNNEIYLSISQISKSLGITTRTELYKSLEKLRNTDIIFEGDNSKTFAKMISSYTRPSQNDNNEHNTQNLIIRFDTKLTETILKYADKYAKLDLNDINNLKISHAITFYEMFIRGLGTRNYQKQHYTEQELRKYLHLNDKYLDIKLFNQKVVKNSIEELNNKTHLNIAYQRAKEDNTNIYKFEIKQEPLYNFNKFKRTILNYECYQNIIFTFKNNEYTFQKDLDDKKPQYLIVSTKTYKTQTTEKAEEIWSFMYELLNKNVNEFVYRFILFNDLDLQDFNFNEFDDNDIEETKLFQDNYKRA